MRMNTRLAKVEKVFRGRPRADQFSLIEIVPVGRESAEGHPPGLYRSGAEGSLAGILVFDPANGEPQVPEGRLAPWGLVIVCGPEYVEPPAEMP